MDTVWGDLLFFVNFCMDFQCLFLTAKLLKRPFSLWRAALFSAFGALYAIVALFIQVPGWVAFFTDCTVCFLMCVGTFVEKRCNTVSVFLPFFIYFGVSFAVGGAMSGMGALLSRLELPVSATGGEVSTVTFFFLAAIGGVSTYLWGRVSRRRAGQERAMLRIGMGERVIKLLAMVDTGNLLTDPVSGKPVVIVAQGAMNSLLSPALLKALSGGVAAMGGLDGEQARRVRLLVTNSVTGQGLLAALVPDWASLDMGRGEVAVEVLVAQAPICVGFDECQALLPAELLKGV